MWGVNSGAWYNMCNNSSYIISFNNLPSLIIINLVYETMVPATLLKLINISQGVLLNPPDSPMFQLSLLGINQLELAGYTMTIRCDQCSIFTDSSNIITNHTCDLCILDEVTL
jgi:hypothetical protein